MNRNSRHNIQDGGPRQVNINNRLTEFEFSADQAECSHLHSDFNSWDDQPYHGNNTPQSFSAHRDSDCQDSSMNGSATESYQGSSKDTTRAERDQVIELITANCFMSSVDIESAYRSVLGHPSQWTYQGLSWK